MQKSRRKSDQQMGTSPKQRIPEPCSAANEIGWRKFSKPGGERGGCGGLQPPSRSWERIKKDSLLAEDKYARLAGKTNFLDLAIFADEQGIVAGFGAAVFPAPFGFGNHFAALLHGGFGAVDQQAVLAGLQLGLTELGGLGEVDIFGKRLGENGHCQRDDGEQSHAAEE